MIRLHASPPPANEAVCRERIRPDMVAQNQQHAQAPVRAIVPQVGKDARKPSSERMHRKEHRFRSPAKSDTADTAQVIIRPPIAWALAAIAGLALNWLVPLPLPFLPAALPARWVGGAVLVLALVLLAWAISTITRAGSNVPTNRPATTIVESGPTALHAIPSTLAGPRNPPAGLQSSDWRSAAVEAETRHTSNRKFDRQHITRLAGVIVAGCTVDSAHFAVGEGVGVGGPVDAFQPGSHFAWPSPGITSLQQFRCSALYLLPCRRCACERTRSIFFPSITIHGEKGCPALDVHDASKRFEHLHPHGIYIHRRTRRE
jgi:hypothetical protein